MTEKPILFSAPMVRAILAGQKAQTRRQIVNLTPDPDGKRWRFGYKTHGVIFQDDARVRDGALDHEGYIKYSKGDTLWVRESWSGLYRYADLKPRDMGGPFWYWADGNPQKGDWTKPKPSIHMPRWASRITLLVTDVRVQRLQDISEEDAKAEGVVEAPGGWWSAAEGQSGTTARAAFGILWDSINGTWDANPWVYAMTFSVASAQRPSEERSDMASKLVNTGA